MLKVTTKAPNNADDDNNNNRKNNIVNDDDDDEQRQRNNMENRDFLLYTYGLPSSLFPLFPPDPPWHNGKYRIPFMLMCSICTTHSLN